MILLRWLADRGPWVLVAGIVAGLALPGVAQILVPFIPHMVAWLLFLAALRIGPKRIVEASGAGRSIFAVLLLSQLVLPLICIAVLWVFGWLGTPWATALVMIAMGSSISGAPNMVQMIGQDGTHSMRLLILGTALLPLTVMPVLYLLPDYGTIAQVVGAALRLLVVIAIASVIAFGLRLTVLRDPSAEVLKAIDGASALTLAVVVIGLMSAVNAAIFETPMVFLAWMAFVLAANFGLQFVAFHLAKGQPADRRAAITVMGGNRNIALFLVALPPEVTTPLLIFIGCYQVPMYLTPIITGWALRRRLA